MQRRRRLFLGVTITIFYTGIFITIAINMTTQRLHRDAARLAHSFDTAVSILADGISSGYLRWDEFHSAVLAGDQPTVEGIFEDARHTFQPWVLELSLSDRLLPAEFHQASFEEGKFNILLAIYDSFDSQRINHTTVLATVDHRSLLAVLYAGSGIVFDKPGYSFSNGLQYSLQPSLGLSSWLVYIFSLVALLFAFAYVTGKQAKIETLNSRLEKLLQVSLLLSIKENRNIEHFLTQFFRAVFSFVPEADFGSVMVLHQDVWRYIDAVGHDIDTLRRLCLPKDAISIYDQVKVLKKLREPDQSMLDPADLQRFRSAVRPIKETLVIPLRTEKGFYGTLSLDVDSNSLQSFSTGSIELMQAFSNLVTSYFVLNEYNEIDRDFQNSLILSIIHLLEIHDPYTRGHSENVAEIARIVAQKMDLPEKDLQRIYWSGLVHDIGKIVISWEILNKPAKLNAEEFSQIQLHPRYGHDVLGKTENLKDIAITVLCHHENFDGSGYPDGIAGEAIPLFSRIIAVADTYDAMTSGRPYRKTVKGQEALAEIQACAGKQFDPAVVAAFLQCYEAGLIDYRKIGPLAPATHS